MMAVKRRENPVTEIERHPLSLVTGITVELNWDEASGQYVTTIPELNGISTFGESEERALDNTAEMLRGWIASMESHGLKIPLRAAELKRVKEAVGLAA